MGPNDVIRQVHIAPRDTHGIRRVHADLIPDKAPPSATKVCRIDVGFDNRAAVKAAPRDKLNLVGTGVDGSMGAVDKVFTSARLQY